MVKHFLSGLADECQTRLGEDPNDPGSIFQKINKVFEYMPLAATVSGKIFCVSSGIGANVTTIEDIQKLKRPLKIDYESLTRESKIVLDLLWSDPALLDSQNDNRVAAALPRSTKTETLSQRARSSASVLIESEAS
jgi:protein phosphatase